MKTLGLLLLSALLLQSPPAPQTAPSVAAAQALAGNGDNAGARAMLEQVVVKEPGNFRAWAALGNVCRRLNDHDGAIKAFSKALEVHPGDPQTMVNMGTAYALKGDADQAFEWLGKAR